MWKIQLPYFSSTMTIFKHYSSMTTCTLCGSHPSSVNLPSIIDQISAEAPKDGTSSATTKQRSWPAVNRFEFSGTWTRALSLIVAPLVSDSPLISWINDYTWCRKNAEYQRTTSWLNGLADVSLTGVGSATCLLLPARELTTTEITLLWFLSLRFLSVLWADSLPDTLGETSNVSGWPWLAHKYNHMLSLIHSNNCTLFW